MAEPTKITVLGTGVLGSQIAYQTAFHGFDVVAYDISTEVLEQAKVRFAGLAATYAKEVAGAADGQADDALARIRLSADLADAVTDADLVIEAIPENLVAQARHLHEARAPSPPSARSSRRTRRPCCRATCRDSPDAPTASWRCTSRTTCGCRTPPRSWERRRRTPPSSRPSSTSPSAIGMVPIEIRKEKAGYLLNSLLVPFLDAAGELVVGGYADPETIDKTWRIGTGAPLGPFQIYDIVGLTTAYNISSHGGAKQQAFAAYLKENYIDQGKLGTSTGEGFYSYK